MSLHEGQTCRILPRAEGRLRGFLRRKTLELRAEIARTEELLKESLWVPQEDMGRGW